MQRLRQKSLLLTAYLELLLQAELSEQVHIFTPTDPHQRGAQLSLSFPCCQGDSATVKIESIIDALKAEGVICDARKPDVIRIAPAPLYNSFKDVYTFVVALQKILSCI